MHDDTPTIDLLIHARWIAPVVPEQKLHENCSVAVDRGKIVGIFPTSQASQQFQAREEHHLQHHLLIPGLVNAHGHAAMSLLRGYADDLALQTWLEQHIWPAESRWVNEEFVTQGTELAMAEMLLSGTTCFADMYFFPESTARSAHQAGMRAQVAFPIFDFPCAWGSGPDEYFSKGLQVFDDYRSNDLITIGFGPHAPYTVSDAPLQKIVTLAEEIDAPIHIHLHETATEIQQSLTQFGQRPVERLHDIGLLGPRTQCVHMTQVTDSDIELLLETHTHIVHCPESNLKLASGFCPVQRLLDAGINVALGTDGAASNNDLDLLGEARTAALLAKAVAEDARALTAHQALKMATYNGAKALGLEDRIGSIETGKEADLCAIAFDDLAALPMYNPISQLIYSHSAQRVSHVWVKGKALVKDRRLLSLDTSVLREKAIEWQQKLAH